MFVKLLLGKRALRRNDKKPVEGAGGEFYYVNGISVAQGPNYGMFQSDYPSLVCMSFSNLSPVFVPISFGQAHAALASSDCKKQRLHRLVKYRPIYIDCQCCTKSYICMGI